MARLLRLGVNVALPGLQEWSRRQNETRKPALLLDITTSKQGKEWREPLPLGEARGYKYITLSQLKWLIFFSCIFSRFWELRFKSQPNLLWSTGARPAHP